MVYAQGTADEYYLKRYGTPRWNVKGRLHKTNRKVKPVRCGTRNIHIDDAKQEWVACFGKWWKFPEEIEY